MAEVQKRRLREARKNRGRKAALWHRTRHVPKRVDELLDGGSMYWVIRGRLAIRQRLLGFESATDDEGRKCCLILLDPELVPTASRRQRAFQGWRYLAAGDAPPDLPPRRDGDDDLPEELAAELRELGLL